MEKNISLFQKICIDFINIYQRTLSYVIGNQCRFYPTCSEYTKQSILKFGSFKGILLGTIRIIRCSPLSKGGIDEVPSKFRLYKIRKKK